MKVLIVGHACCPDMGSEPGFTWNYSWSLAAEHEVYVIAHPQFRPAVDRFLERNPPRNIHMLWADVPAHLDPWHPERGERWIRLHYLLWNQAACKVARELLRTVHIDIAHHISWGTVSASPFLSKLPVPFVWGPVGGGQSPPRKFLRYFGRYWPLEMVRSARIRALPLTPWIRRAAKAAASILATNHETAGLLRSAGAKSVELCLDSSLSADRLAKQFPWRDHKGLTLMWAGRLEHRKALPLVFEALAECRDVPIELFVAGDGPLRQEWESLARRLSLPVEFFGYRPWTEMTTLFQRADAFIFSSLRDSFGSVVLEAMGHGLPIITLNHQGVGAFVPEDAGLKVPVTNPTQTVRALVQAVRQLAHEPEQRREMGLHAWRFAREHTWERRVERMVSLYREISYENCAV
jgi:glycosyltransferase involved in cell wall biosynthesis